MKKIFIFTVITVFIIAVQGDTIFPGMYGDSLIDSIIKYYKSYSNLGYDDGRDVLYGEIDNHSNYLTCVYTGYEIYLNPSADPSSDAYNKGINCEHTWPQSFGADGIAKGDLHHLYPTEIDVNSARGNLPFAEINDNNTDTWYINNVSTTTKPTNNIDEYSERDVNVAFEPREDHKGNVSRSMFYFYTMYSAQYQAVDSDESFWNGQKDDLFDWHYLDIVDAAEIQRTNDIAIYQENKPNPFVLDTTLIRRAYYPHLVGIIDAVKKADIILENNILCMNVFSHSFPIISIDICDITGRVVYSNEYNDYYVSIRNSEFPSAGRFYVSVKTGAETAGRFITIIK